MQLSTQIADHLKQVYFGGNWTSSHLQDQLKDVDWKMATTRIYDFNTIAQLVYHVNYFVKVVIPVLEGKPFDAHDKYSFDHPPIENQQDWERFLESVFQDGNRLAELIEQMSEEEIKGPFIDPKYGHYHRILVGTIEHFHYHLGQIV